MHDVRPTFLVIAVIARAIGGCATADAAASSDDNLTASGASDGSPKQLAAFEAFAAKRGLARRSDRALVIGIRGRAVDGTVHPTRVVRELDDTVIVLTPDARLVRLAASTHPWETNGTSGVPDVDHANGPDVGMIRPGIYVAVRRDESRNIAGARTYAVTTTAGGGAIPGWRNTDHDDRYSAEEVAASEAREDALTDILFHQAGAGAPPAVGCQVFDAAGIRRLSTEVGPRFDYLLVDVNSDPKPEEIPPS